MNAKLWSATIVAALGGLLFGFDTAVINGTTTQLRDVFQLSEFMFGPIELGAFTLGPFELGEFMLGFTVSIALIGTIPGALFVGKPCDVIGRRGVLFILALLYLVSALGSALAWNWYSFLCFRFIGGLAVGGASVVSPMYIAELSPARYRGRLVAVAQFNIVVGILLAFFSNYLIAFFELGAMDWRWMFGAEAVPATVFFLLLFFNPRSPRWLVGKGRVDEARTVLEAMGNDRGSVQDEIQAIQDALARERHDQVEPVFQSKYTKPLLLGAVIAAFNQLSGINAVIYYSGDIFQMAGADKDDALLQTVCVGGINLIVTLAAMAVIDLFGRKRLMLVGSVGYIASLVSMATVFFTSGDGDEVGEIGKWVLLVGMMVFVASHAFGQGSVIWVFLSEIFPGRIRARGQAFASFVLWVFCAAVSWLFPVIAGFSPGFVFSLFAALMVCQLIWVIAAMPETKGIPLEEIEQRLGIK